MKNLNQKGFSILEVSIGAAAMVGLGAVTLSLMSSLQGGQRKASIQLGLAGARTEIARALASPEAYKNTVAANSLLFACIKNGEDCAGTLGANRPLQLRSGGDASTGKDKIIPYASTSPNEGFDIKGAQCNDFDAINGNNKCPYKYEVMWRPICVAGAGHCKNPTVELRAELSVRYDTRIPRSRDYPDIDPAKYRIINLHGDTSSNPVAQTCLMINGSIDNPTDTKNCTPLFHNTSTCPANTYIVGFEANGRPICQALVRFRCPMGQVLNGINTDGTARCEGGCADASGSFDGSFFSRPGGG